jgi:hypothetical protein
VRITSIVSVDELKDLPRTRKYLHVRENEGLGNNHQVIREVSVHVEARVNVRVGTQTRQDNQSRRRKLVVTRLDCYRISWRQLRRQCQG